MVAITMLDAALHIPAVGCFLATPTPRLGDNTQTPCGFWQTRSCRYRFNFTSSPDAKAETYSVLEKALLHRPCGARSAGPGAPRTLTSLPFPIWNGKIILGEPEKG